MANLTVSEIYSIADYHLQFYDKLETVIKAEKWLAEDRDQAYALLSANINDERGLFLLRRAVKNQMHIIALALPGTEKLFADIRALYDLIKKTNDKTLHDQKIPALNLLKAVEEAHKELLFYRDLLSRETAFLESPNDLKIQLLRDFWTKERKKQSLSVQTFEKAVGSIYRKLGDEVTFPVMGGTIVSLVYGVGIGASTNPMSLAKGLIAGGTIALMFTGMGILAKLHHIRYGVADKTSLTAEDTEKIVSQARNTLQLISQKMKLLPAGS